MSEGQFDQHFMELFARGEGVSTGREERAALVLTVLLLLATVGGILLF